MLRVLGSATALAVLPADAAAVWARVVSGLRPVGGLSDEQLALISLLADTVIPRTDTPSAADVQVPAFVNVIVSENYDDAERTRFVAGLSAIDAMVKAGDATSAITALEAATDRREDPARTWWRLKGLIVHGYFTSERVAKDVLKVNVMPGRFDGDAPMKKTVTRHG